EEEIFLHESEEDTAPAKPQKQTPPPKKAAQAIPEGREGNYLIRIAAEFSEQFTSNNPGKCRVLGRQGEDVMIIVKTTFGQLKSWAVNNALTGQVVKPDAVREEIKSYFDEAAWRYR
ncbi:MAG: hypothetical protein GX061_08530, partial [Eubacteriaceae bacterium]|nr:hypothetical protein [Eubacteriaceae bacterium]